MNERPNPASAPGIAPDSRRVGRRRWVGPLAVPIILIGSALAVVAGALPVWGVRMVAPQYPKGLSLWFYGGRVDGPLREINGLNHYIGMRPIDLAAVPELVLWPLAVVGTTCLLILAVVARSWLGRLALIGLLLVPIVVLADIQRWLIVFGSQLDPSSALRLDPFVPLVVGPSSVWNFTIWTYPGPALAAIWLMGGLAWLGRRAERPSMTAAGLAGVGALALAVAGTLAVVVPAVRSTGAPSGPARSDPPAGTVDLVRLVAEAPAGATVVVPAGSYRVHLVIDRPLTLVADGPVVLDGGGRGTVLTIAASDVTVRGFRVVGTGGQVEDAAAIKTVDAERVTIEQNRIEDAFSGISVNGGSEVRIVGNELVGSGQVADGGHAGGSGGGPAEDGGTPAVSGESGAHADHGEGAGPGGQGDGIVLWNVRGALVRDNVVRDLRDGIYLNYAEETLVDGNRIESSRYAVHVMYGSSITVFGNELHRNLSGLVLMSTKEVMAGRNAIVDARSPGTGFGVVVKDVVTLRLAENLIARNRVGLQVEGTVNRVDAEAAVVSNRFASNDVGVALMPSADLMFGGNEFDMNLTQVASLGRGVELRNHWTFHGIGNTWSDYRGYDLAADGTGDMAYRAAGMTDQVMLANPRLAAYRASPALALLATSQSVWEGYRQPVVIDQSPRTAQVGTTAVPRVEAAEASPGPWWVAAAGLAGLALLAVRAARRGMSRPVRASGRGRPA